jgi:peptide deformylase
MNQTPSSNISRLKAVAGQVLPITKYPDSILKTPCSPAREISPDLLALAFDMLVTMQASGLVGLAAPQVGRTVDLMVLDVRSSKRSSRLFLGGQEVAAESVMPMILFNTEIAPHVNLCGFGFESCGSVPGIRAQIERPAATSVSAINQDGERVQFACADLLASIIQHEWDHLRGILFMDRMSPESLSSAQPQLGELRNARAVADPTPVVTSDG